MSQSVEGASIAEFSHTPPAGRVTKMQRVWELVSELVRVIVSRDPAPAETPSSARSSEVDPPIPAPVIARRGEPRGTEPRRFFRRASESSTPVSAVWRSVQSRALESSLKRPESDSTGSDVGGTESAQLPIRGEGEIDWSPFIMARLSDDFAHPAAHALPD